MELYTTSYFQKFTSMVIIPFGQVLIPPGAASSSQVLQQQFVIARRMHSNSDTLESGCCRMENCLLPGYHGSLLPSPPVGFSVYWFFFLLQTNSTTNNVMWECRLQTDTDNIQTQTMYLRVGHRTLSLRTYRKKGEEIPRISSGKNLRYYQKIVYLYWTIPHKHWYK